jgi:hypothetical protein
MLEDWFMLSLFVNFLFQSSRLAEKSKDVMVGNEETSNGRPDSNKDKSQQKTNLGKWGTPGIDFPVYKSIPRTDFTCRGMENGYFADISTNCQV